MDLAVSKRGANKLLDPIVHIFIGSNNDKDSWIQRHGRLGSTKPEIAQVLSIFTPDCYCTRHNYFTQ